MNCYWCELEPGPGGTRIRPITASAVCTLCGAAVCRVHGVPAASPPLGIRCLRCQNVAVTSNRPR